MPETVSTDDVQPKAQDAPTDAPAQPAKVSGSSSGGRMPPSLDQLAARLKTGSPPQPAPPPGQATKSRLPASLLRSVSQQSGVSSITTTDSLAVNASQTRTGSPDLSTVSTPSASATPASLAAAAAVPPTDTALTTENLEKLNIDEDQTSADDKQQQQQQPAAAPAPAPQVKQDSYPRGYKNIPSLDAITQRIRKTRTLSMDGSAMPSPGGTGLPGIGADESQLDKIEEFMKERDAEEQRNNEHPLQYRWTIYHDSKTKAPAPPPSKEEPWTPPPTAETNAYEAQLTVVGDFKTVESYCRYMNWLKPPSMLERNSNYHLFKDKIKPMWEDEANENGGKWVLTMRNNPQLLDRCWSYLTMAMVGEELEDADELCGAVVSLRAKVDRIQLWTRSKTDIERLNGIAKKMITLLGVSEADNVGLEFQYHSEDHPPPNKFISMTSSFGFAGGNRSPFVHGGGNDAHPHRGGFGGRGFGRGAPGWRG